MVLAVALIFAVGGVVGLLSHSRARHPCEAVSLTLDLSRGQRFVGLVGSGRIDLVFIFIFICIGLLAHGIGLPPMVSGKRPRDLLASRVLDVAARSG